MDINNQTTCLEETGKIKKSGNYHDNRYLEPCSVVSRWGEAPHN